MGGGSAPHSWGSAAAVASRVARIYTYRSEAITRSKRDAARRPPGGRAAWSLERGTAERCLRTHRRRRSGWLLHNCVAGHRQGQTSLSPQPSAEQRSALLTPPGVAVTQ